MFRQWKQDPTKVHASWDTYFRHAENGTHAFASPYDLKTSATPTEIGASTSMDLAVTNLIRAYQFGGHLRANLDPLGLLQQEEPYELGKYLSTELNR